VYEVIPRMADGPTTRIRLWSPRMRLEDMSLSRSRPNSRSRLPPWTEQARDTGMPAVVDRVVDRRLGRRSFRNRASASTVFDSLLQSSPISARWPSDSCVRPASEPMAKSRATMITEPPRRATTKLTQPRTGRTTRTVADGC